MRSHKHLFALPVRLALLLLLFYLSVPALAKKENRTIDDNDKIGLATHNPPLYQPYDMWNFGPDCTVCLAKLDRSKTYNGTWHDTTAYNLVDPPKNVTLTFNGTALYVFAAVPNNVGWGDITHMYLSFILDGKPLDPYTHDPENRPDIDYQRSVYNNSALPNGQHTFVITPMPIGKAPTSFFFDYATYTYDDGVDDTTSSLSSTATSSTTSTASTNNDHPSTNVGAIAGGVAGGVVALLLAALGAFFCIRRRRGSPQNHGIKEKSFNLDGGDVEHLAHGRQPAAGSLPSANPGIATPNLRNNGVVPSYGSPADATLYAGNIGATYHSSKSAARQAALESRIVDLTRAQPSLYSPTVGDGDTSVLEEVNALRQEVERLRAQNAPPAYYGNSPTTSGEEAVGQTAAGNERAWDVSNDTTVQRQVVPHGQRPSGKKHIVNGSR